MVNLQTNTVLRLHQEGDPDLGQFFQALHAFADRTTERYFDDAPDLPHPVIGFEKVRSTCKGIYRIKDGLTLVHSITIDPYKVTNGAEAAEVLAHEMVHMWLAHVGRATERNYHSAEFHNRMGLYGILTDGKRGHHVGYTEGDQWQDWLDENSDLRLVDYLLPGVDETPGRQMVKWQCPTCGFSFHSRRQDVNVICMEEDCAMPVERAEDD